MVRAGAAVLFTALLLVLGACSSPSFNSRWEKADATQQTNPYAGAWVGRWASKRHPGEGGELWCILTPVGSEGTEYTAEFKARWRGVFESSHSVTLQVPAGQTSQPLQFAGTSELHTVLGRGTYYCQGVMTPVKFGAKYNATYDSGLLELGRPQ